MKKTLSRIGTLLAAAMLTLGVLAVPAFAADFDYGTDGAEATGGTVKLHKYLVVEKDTNNPAITFSYTLTPGTTVDPATTGKLPVFAGIGSPTVANVTFAAATATTPGAAGDPIEDATKWYTDQDITLDFSSVTFPKPGVYRYILTEANSNAQSIGGVLYDVDEPDGTEQTRIRTIDVYVEDPDDGTNELAITGYVSYMGTVSAAPNQAYDPAASTATDEGYVWADEGGTGISAKSDTYINQIKTNTMTAQKIIAGNQGDKESKWQIKVDFVTLPTGTNVKYAKVVDNGVPVANPTYADYTSGTAVTYGHQDKYKFIGIPEGIAYTVTETDANKEGYTTTYANPTYTFTNDGTVEDKDNATVTNTREGTVPTGLFLNYKPFWIMGALALVVAVVVLRTRANRFNDEF